MKMPKCNWNKPRFQICSYNKNTKISSYAKIMLYEKLSVKDIDFSSFDDKIHAVFIEVDIDGSVKREIGIDIHNRIIHKYPSLRFKYGSYGFFDHAVFDASTLEGNVFKSDFEIMWETVY